MQPVLLIDFGSTYTKVTAVDIDEETILGTARAFTTITTDINEGLEYAVGALETQTGKLDYTARYACSSAAGGLRMITVGLVPDLTAEAAKRAALSAGAKVIKVYSYELGTREVEEISLLQPDIILLTGGTDGGNKNVILHNAKVIAQIQGDFPVVLAGNRCAVQEAEELLSLGGKDVKVCENVMPEFNVLNILPARETIREVFLKRIIRAKGLTRVRNLIEGILMPTPSAVLKALQTLAVGAGKEKGIGDLVGVDVGGATTDVYSITDGKPTKTGVLMKGLPEPFAKRTVEGDLGVRYSAAFLCDAVGMENVAQCSGLEVSEVMDCLAKIKSNPDILPSEDPKIEVLDFALTSLGVKEAVSRHAGSIETAYTPFGVTYVQTGKDLTEIKKIIGTGGPVIHSKRAGDILKQVLRDPENPELLKPMNAEAFIDKKYILAAMGLLSEHHPETAIRIMKKELEMT